jgi:hypothetical protein
VSELTVQNFCIGTLVLSATSGVIMWAVAGAKEAMVLALTVTMSRVLVYAVWR